MRRLLLVGIICIAEVLLCAADSSAVSEETLKKLSAAGEQYVDEEIKQALLGIKQVKEVMEKKEEKHRHLMDALRHSSDKRKGAMQLAWQTEQKLDEAEQQCQDLTKSSFEECRPCLEDTCKAFFASTCRRGFTFYSMKVEDFFRKMAAQLEATEHVYNQNEESSGRATNSPEKAVVEDEADLELLKADALFRQLLSNVSLLDNQSITLAKQMQQEFGHSFMAAFTSEIQPSQPAGTQGDSSSGFFGTVGVDHILDSVYDFGRNVMEEFSSTMADVFEETQEAEDLFYPSRDNGSLSASGQSQGRQLCRRLRRQASECWQLQSLCEMCEEYLLTECPSVQQLHSELEEMHTLLNGSRQQQNDWLQLVQRHTVDTQRWLINMEDKYGWVGRLANNTGGPHDIFSLITVSPQQQLRSIRPKADSSVVLIILDSAPITVSVPAELEVEDPAFIEYAAQEALTLFKWHIDPCTVET